MYSPYNPYLYPTWEILQWASSFFEEYRLIVLLSKSYEEGYRLIEIITASTYQWPITRANACTTESRHTGVYEVIENISLPALVAEIHQIMKNLITPKATKSEPVKVVAYVYCGRAYMFEKCIVNHVCANYVGNNNRFNNPYNNIYIPGWRNIQISHGVTIKVNWSLKLPKHHKFLLVLQHLPMVTTTCKTFWNHSFKRPRIIS